MGSRLCFFPAIFVSSTYTDGNGLFLVVRREALPDKRFCPSVQNEDLFELSLPYYPQQGVSVPIPYKRIHMSSNTLEATLATFDVVRYSDLGSSSNYRAS